MATAQEELCAVMGELRKMEMDARNKGAPVFSTPEERRQPPLDARELRRLWRDITTRAEASGAAKMTLDEINAEIEAARRQAVRP